MKHFVSVSTQPGTHIPHSATFQISQSLLAMIIVASDLFLSSILPEVQLVFPS